MEALLGLAVMISTQLYKWFVVKIGAEKAKSWTLFVAFFLTFGAIAGWKGYAGELQLSDAESIASVFGIAVAAYEVVVKRVLTPIFNKFNKKS